MRRINIFPNGDHSHKCGRVVLLTPSTTEFEQFAQQCVETLGLQQQQEEPKTQIRLFTKHGGQIVTLDELVHDDTLFISVSNEPFAHSEPPHKTTPPATAAKPSSFKETRSVLVLHVKRISQGENVEQIACKEINLRLKHREGSVEKLKCKIGKRFACLHPRDQTLIYKGSKLEDGQLLKRYFPYGLTSTVGGNENSLGDQLGQQEEATVFCIVKQISIFVRTPSGSVVPVDKKISHTSTVQYLKRRVMKLLPVPQSSDVQLIFEGKTLHEGNILSDYQVYSGCVMHLFVKN